MTDQIHSDKHDKLEQALSSAIGSSPFGCKCQTMAHHVLGDGCDICNPELAKELEADYQAQLEEDIREEKNERLRGIHS